jgi:hypothetical protein
VAGRTSPARKPTATSDFGVGRRENHDASAFYARFAPPRLSDDDQVGRTSALDVIRAVRGGVVFEPCLAGADHGHDPLLAIRRHAPS